MCTTVDAPFVVQGHISHTMGSQETLAKRALPGGMLKPVGPLAVRVGRERIPHTGDLSSVIPSQLGTINQIGDKAATWFNPLR